MLERDVINKLRKALTDAGVKYIRKNHGGMYARAGRPDLEILHNGKFYALEVKRGENELKTGVTALQWKEIEAIQEAGSAAWAVTLKGETVLLKSGEQWGICSMTLQGFCDMIVSG